MNSKIFAGLEEIFARLLSACLVIIVFVIIVVAREEVTLDWLPVAGWLLLFWFVYELISIVLFNLFVFFSRRSTPPEIDSSKTVDLAMEETTTEPPSTL